MSKSESTLTSFVKRFRSDQAAGLCAVYQLNLTGDDGGSWHMTVADQQCTLADGPAPRPDVIITIAAEDWADLLAGRLDGYTAFMHGRVDVQGDLTMALRLQALFGF